MLKQLIYYEMIWYVMDDIWISGANWGLGAVVPQDFQNNINFIGFIDSISNMYMHIKLHPLLVHELTFIVGADTKHLAWRRKRIFSTSYKILPPPQEVGELAQLI